MQAANVYVDHFALALGGELRTVEESAQAGRLLSEPAALRAAGFAQHRLAAADTSALDLARAAVAELGRAPRAIDALVYGTCLPQSGNVGSPSDYARTRDVKHLMDFPASRLQAEQGWDDALLIGLNQQACAGLVGSLRLAAALLRAEPERERVLCLMADRFPEGALYEQAYNLMSDGATACLVSREPHGFRLLATHAITNGALSCVPDEQTAGAFFGYACGVIESTLARAGLAVSDLDWLVPQNMNRRALEVLARLLGLSAEQVLVPTLAEIGHVVCGDNLANLRAALEAEVICPGQRVLVFMAGYGLTWQGLLLERV
jgi:3-oxoacyl-[acyl-carrier-protein] synthase-3